MSCIGFFWRVRHWEVFWWRHHPDRKFNFGYVSGIIGSRQTSSKQCFMRRWSGFSGWVSGDKISPVLNLGIFFGTSWGLEGHNGLVFSDPIEFRPQNHGLWTGSNPICRRSLCWVEFLAGWSGFGANRIGVASRSGRPEIRELLNLFGKIYFLGGF